MSNSEREREAGSVLLEAALILPLFLFVLYGLIIFGLALSVKQTVTEAAAEGARAAIGAQPIGAETQTAAWTRVASAQALNALASTGHAVAGDVTSTVGSCGTGMCVTVQIVYPYATFAPPDLLGVVNPSTLTSKAVVEVS